MKARLEDDEVVMVDEVHQAMLLGDPAGPRPGKQVLEGLRLPDPVSRITQCVIDQPVDPLEDLPIGLEPMLVVVPAVRSEDQPHSASSCSCLSPDMACWRLSNSRLALAGTRSRYAVSSRAAYSSADTSTALPRREVISTVT